MSKSRDNVLDECLERLLLKGETIEQCLESFPKHAEELKPLLETALAARQASAIQPRSEFRDKARYQFQVALREMEAKKSRPFPSWSWQPRWAATVAIALILLLASSGTVAAASGSMPDEPLYPVKLATEQVRLTLTFLELGKAELHAQLADTRVIEIIYLTNESKPEKIERTVNRLNEHLIEVAVLSLPPEVMGGVAMAPAVEEAVKEAMVAQEAEVTEEMSVAEDEQTIGEAPSVPEQARGGKKASVKDDRRAKLKESIAHQANNNTARLRALLETAPESAKPALMRAISVSETGYKKALESLE
ncbi:DUF5667 domain-containing protein [Chloroflexota bacterium]